MNRLVLPLFLMLASPAFAEDAPVVQRIYALDATGSIQITPEGKVDQYVLDTPLEGEIGALVDRSIRAWTFEPVRVDGQPVMAKTRLRLALEVQPVGAGQYEVKVGRLSFGEPVRRSDSMVPPRFPREAQQAGLQARVILGLKLDDRGHVVAVHAVQTSLSAAGNEKIEARWRRLFEQASMDAAKKWTFDLTESYNGKVLDTEIRVPITYSFTSDNAWRSFIPGPFQPEPWATPGAVASDSAGDLREGQVQSRSTRFKLTREVVGTVL